ncbi:odorant receptor 85b-like [Achroia grisella]|uniref:odorant receptor 85b-like n=1 Tax=Achroia grisella TaxID=688607 RepID=UPI0027D2522C|nr:odorant receptor 85b-like [Achroia grisella]
MIEPVNEVQRENEYQIDHEKELLDIIMQHRTLLRLSINIENLYGFPLLFNFMNSSVILCFCTFCCVVIEKWYEFMYKSCVVTTLCQTWFICWYGQKLINSGEKISLALYNCGWYYASHKNKRNLQIMMRRAQRKLCVTTYGFAVICLESYTTIIKTSWSYFTLIFNAYKINQNKDK